MPKPDIRSFFDPTTSTVTHVVACPVTRRAAIIDPVLDYDPKSGRTSTVHADEVIAHVQAQALGVDWILETHAHADHLSAAPYLKQRLGGGRVAIGGHIAQVQQVFRGIFNDEGIPTDGQPFDHLFTPDERFQIGELPVRVMHTPGHTPACISYLVEGDDGIDAFIGDTLFMPDYGSARCDFPGGDASVLYRSVRALLSLPPATRLHLCHDYPPTGPDGKPLREPRWVCTVAEQRAGNVHLHDGVAEADFVTMRRTRDAKLAMPVLLLPSIQVNVRAGQFPQPESNGKRYLKIPVDVV
jgi:glyoxylase-like metal-dependent hydrolase (beta-lactamase superfamily II)